MMIKVIVNGQEKVMEDKSNIIDLIAMIKCDTNKVAIECNSVIVPRSRHHLTNLQDGDVVECVEFIGGG